MKNSAFELDLQAYLDGELSPRRSRKIAASLERDPSARALLEQLKQTKTLLRDHQPHYPLNETREFYWSKIEAGIRRAPLSKPRSPRIHWNPVWLRWAAPATLTVASTLFLGFWYFQSTSPQNQAQTSEPVVLAVGHELETPNPTLESFTFRHEKEGMTVVWVQTP